MSSENLQKVRIDKWLWAARFFKTRSLAKTAIDGGKVRLDGQRVKASKEIEVGMCLTIRQGWDDKEVNVLALSEQRRGAPEAQSLYEETQSSIEKRTQRALERKTQGPAIRTTSRPTGRDRRQLDRIKREILDGD